MSNNGKLLALTNKEVWPSSVQDLHTYQVDDGTIFYYDSRKGRLFVKWQEREIDAKLSFGFGITQLTAFYPHGNGLFFEANRKIYRAFFVPPDAIAIAFVRNLLETEQPRRNGLCYRDKFVHRICDDPARGGILVDVSQQESRKLRLEGLHRGMTLYNQFSYETFYPSARKMGENAIAILCSGTLYSHRDSSSFVYISCGKNLFTLNTSTMTFLPYLQFGPNILIHSIVGVYNGVITVTGKNCGERAMMSAELPEGYFDWTTPYHGELEQSLQRENRELKASIEDKDARLRKMQATIDQFQTQATQLKLQVDDMNEVLKQSTLRSS